ncbi:MULTISPECIES: hypothetical protein [Cryobacterium]|uniref:hypothetical protein n=1 Tax=Cryobacterium TaxID=69578 RepID=UPI001057023B|nr:MULTISPECIES: hypothetical protein [Cryobacterium]TFC41189.1 hypothetical protein E3O57_16965 [Cryobacterium sp. TMN-39-2]
MDSERSAGTSVRGWLARGASVLVAVAVFAATQAGMYLANPGWSINRFRAFFEHDQLGYLAIVTNFSEGQFQDVEPDTETGSNTYPRAYYEFAGLVARAFGLTPITAWNVTGLVAQLVLVAVLATVLITAGNRWWMGLLAPIPFLLGTFAVFQGDGWYTELASHAVLWGPFAVLHPLNGEAVSLSIAGMVLLSLGWLWWWPHGKRVRLFGTIGLSLVIGLLANVQTYSFIAAVYFLAGVLAVLTIVSGRWLILAVVSIGLIPVLFVWGPRVAAEFGQLPALVFGLLPMAPGLGVLIVRTRGVVVLFFGAAALGASPQIAATVGGLAAGDPFLLYRVASNSQLGVPAAAGLLGGTVLIVPLVGIAIAGLIRRRPEWAAYALGGATAWLLLASNDLWGANAEPYRLWIDMFFLIAATILPVLVLVARDLRALSAGRWVGLAGFAVVAVLAFLSMGDFVRFAGSFQARALMDTDSDRYRVAAGLARESASESPGTLLIVGPCLDPRVVKVTAGVPIAYFHYGMAWPEDFGAVNAIVAAGGALDPVAARQASATLVLTDGRCSNDWAARYADILVPQSSGSYVASDGTTATLTISTIR